MTAVSRLTLALTALALLVPHVASAVIFGVSWEAEDFSLPGDGLPASYIGDMNGDGEMEIVGRFGTTAQIRDLRTGEVHWTGQSYQVQSASFTMMDIDNDGTMEVLCLGNDVLVLDWFIAAAPPANDTPSAD